MFLNLHWNHVLLLSLHTFLPSEVSTTSILGFITICWCWVWNRRTMFTVKLCFFVWWTQIIQTLALNFYQSILSFNLTVDCLILSDLFFLNILIWLIIKASTLTLIGSSSGIRDIRIFGGFNCRAFATYLINRTFKLKAFSRGILIIMESYFL